MLEEIGWRGKDREEVGIMRFTGRDWEEVGVSEGILWSERDW